MARKEILESTIKKLFALSGNECAFPGCTQAMIEDGQVIGAICHIEAANGEGERYNPNQTDDERRDFSNLILLCPTHHTITNNVDKYPVDILKQMKSDHENRFASSIFEVNDSVVQQVYQDYISQYNINVITGIQAITQSGDINIGLSFTEIQNVFEILFTNNFPRLQEEAQRIAKERVDLFSRDFFEQAQRKGSSVNIEAFSNPDVQFVLEKAIEASARRDSNELRSILSSLLVDRIANNNDDFYTLLLDEAIIASSRLTKDQFMLMAISLTLTEHLYYREFVSWKDLDLYVNKYVAPLFGSHINRANVRYIEYTGCGGINITSFGDKFYNYIQNEFPDLFKLPINLDTIKQLRLSDEWLGRIFKSYNEESFIFSGSSVPTELYSIIEDEPPYRSKYELVNELFDKYVIYNSYTDETKKNGTEKILQELEYGSELLSAWDDDHLGILRLNSVGYVIAATYCSQVLGEEIDVRAILNI